MIEMMKIKRNEGFTFIEVITTITLMALLLAMVMPSLQQSYQQLQMDVAIQTLHKNIRWAQRLADKEQKRVHIRFYPSEEPCRYEIYFNGTTVCLKEETLPDGLTKTELKSIIIRPDKTFKNNGHILIQKGDITRYVYYYQTGRSRVAAKAE